jgi:hypothetical protein
MGKRMGEGIAMRNTLRAIAALMAGAVLVSGIGWPQVIVGMRHRGGKKAVPPLGFVGTAIGSYNGVGQTTVASTAANHASGDLLLVMVNAVGTSAVVNGVADTAGNTYTAVAAIQHASNSTIQWWYAKDIGGNAANVVTATFAANVAQSYITVQDIQGASLTAPIDAGATTTGNGTYSFGITTGTFSTSHAKEIIFFGGQTSGGSVSFSPGNIGAVASTGTTTGMTADGRGFAEYAQFSATQTNITAGIGMNTIVGGLWQTTGIISELP